MTGATRITRGQPVRPASATSPPLDSRSRLGGDRYVVRDPFGAAIDGVPTPAAVRSMVFDGGAREYRYDGGSSSSSPYQRDALLAAALARFSATASLSAVGGGTLTRKRAS